MAEPRIGSLFSGYCGLDMGVQAVLGGQLAWFVEYDEAPSKILKHHWPDVPNYGDVTTLDWSAVSPVEIVTAGYPCQPFSTAGKRKGSNDERHLWPYVLDAVRYLRPRLVVLENVRGHLTLGFDRVLGDLAEAGYDAEWICLPASDAGAPHRRERIFILAHPRGEALGLGAGLRASEAPGVGGRRPDDHSVQAPVTDTRRDGREGHEERDVGPGEPEFEPPFGADSDRRSAADPERDGGERRRAAGDVASATREGASEGDQRERDGDASDDRWRTAGAWGPFAPVIEHWAGVLGRFAPAPTRPDGRLGRHRLSPEFVEWMMGLPEGHVTGVQIKREAQLKALGNGVVPQHAALAVATLVKEWDMNLNIEGGGQ